LRGIAPVHRLQLGRQVLTLGHIEHRPKRIYELIEAGRHSPQFGTSATTHAALGQMTFGPCRLCRRQFVIKKLSEESI